MTAEGHLFFSIACAVFAKNAELTPVLAQALSLALPAADPCAAQGQSARTRLVYGAVRLCRLDAADAGG